MITLITLIIHYFPGPQGVSFRSVPKESTSLMSINNPDNPKNPDNLHKFLTSHADLIHLSPSNVHNPHYKPKNFEENKEKLSEVSQNSDPVLVNNPSNPQSEGPLKIRSKELTHFSKEATIIDSVKGNNPNNLPSNPNNPSKPSNLWVIHTE